MTKTYHFDYDYLEAEARFEIDTDKFTAELAKETLEFFTWQYDKEADPVDEVMKKYAMEAIRIATFNNYNAFGVTSDFKNKEGFAPIDGSKGIKLMMVSAYEFDEEKLEMKIK